MRKIDFDELIRDGFYEYLTNKGHELSKQQLIDMCRELAYAAEQNNRSEYPAIEEEAIRALMEIEGDE